MFFSICKSLESDEIIKNNEVFCSQAANNNKETYCQCLQAQECVDESRFIYGYRTGEDIIDVFAYSVSFDCNFSPPFSGGQLLAKYYADGNFRYWFPSNRIPYSGF